MKLIIEIAILHRSRELCIPYTLALLNHLILAALEEKFDCIRLVAIDGVEEHVRPGNSFVDDTTCGVTDDDITSEPVSSAALELV
jgi:hypothetical protein